MASKHRPAGHNGHGYTEFEGLILTRMPGQDIVIGDGLVVVEVLSTKKGRVRIRVKAPRELRVLRGELVQDPPHAASA